MPLWIMSDDYWKHKERCHTYGRGFCYRYMEPSCCTSFMGPDIQLVLYMPYLHWSNRKEHEHRSTALEAMFSTSIGRSGDYEHTRHDPLRRLRGISVLGDLCHHPRRTLDQFYYRSIETKNRDNDQIVSHKNPEQVLMVDQLATRRPDLCDDSLEMAALCLYHAVTVLLSPKLQQDGGFSVKEESDRAAGSAKDALKRINEFEEDMTKYQKDAVNVRQSLLFLLDLKPKKANLDEARATHKLTEASQIEQQESVEQGWTMMIFTVFTIVFLPLSFYTSLYGMNIKEWAGEQKYASARSVAVYMGSISTVVILIALILAFWFRKVKELFLGFFKWMKEKATGDGESHEMEFLTDRRFGDSGDEPKKSTCIQIVILGEHNNYPEMFPMSPKNKQLQEPSSTVSSPTLINQ
ncbi:hypothetical protein K440DRAFT_666037 [Wilcoxina mikolae CBS 423.85]|nr:hypothetical protein K440DRAFT_666037 [Wilcoxina mikolae CBS 423.85]